MGATFADVLAGAVKSARGGVPISDVLALAERQGCRPAVPREAVRLACQTHRVLIDNGRLYGAPPKVQAVPELPPPPTAAEVAEVLEKRPRSKLLAVLEAVRRPEGASVKEIQAALEAEFGLTSYAVAGMSLRKIRFHYRVETTRTWEPPRGAVFRAT